MPKWTPATEGAGFELTEILQPLKPFHDQVNVISDLRARAGVRQRRHGEPQSRGRRVLSGAFAEDRRAAAARHHGRSDRRAEDRSGHAAAVARADDRGTEPELRRRSELLLSRHDLLAGADTRRCRCRTTRRSCSSGCSATATPRSSARRGAISRSACSTRCWAKHRRCSGSCRRRIALALDQYLTDVREIERRVQKAGQQLSDDLPIPAAPTGVPRDVEEHIKLMFDLQVLAWQAEITRVSTFLMCKELSNAVYPKSGVRDAFHTLSHHSNVPREHGPLRDAEHVSRGAVRLFPGQAAVDAGWRRHAARSLDGALRQRDERRQPAQSHRPADPPGGWRIGPPEGRTPSASSRRTRRWRTCWWRCSTSSRSPPTSSATARDRFRCSPRSSVFGPQSCATKTVD